jgi:hypothetical protein
MALLIVPNQMVFTGGTWSDAAASHVWTKDKAAAANTSLIRIPLSLPHNRVPLKGSYLVSLDVWLSVGTADLNALSAEIYRMLLPGNGESVQAPASQAFTYDAAHDTAAKRISQDFHKVTLTLSAPFWLDAGDEVYAELSVNAAAGSVVKIYGAHAGYTLRV